MKCKDDKILSTDVSFFSVKNKQLISEYVGKSWADWSHIKQYWDVNELHTLINNSETSIGY